jgi:hemoglobin
MGGEDVIWPLCNDLYERHASDPLTAPWFGPSRDHNSRTAKAVKEHVYAFFSAGIGGPHKYKGRSMKVRRPVPADRTLLQWRLALIPTDRRLQEAHNWKHAKISNAAIHALTNHVLEQMYLHAAGDEQEREEVLKILKSLYGDVLSAGIKEFPKASKSLWERLGGEDIVRPMCDDLYNLHASDPLTAPWFGNRTWNDRIAAHVKEHVFTFFSSGIGGPHKYAGRSMAEAHAKMREQKPITEVAFHALTTHVLIMMERHQAGGEQEREEVLAILQSLKADVVFGGTKEL